MGGIGCGEAKRKPQSSTRIYKQGGWERVTKAGDANRNKQTWNKHKARWSSGFCSFSWDLRDVENLQGQTSLYTPKENISRFQRRNKIWRPLTTERVYPHDFLFVPLLKRKHSSSKETKTRQQKRKPCLRGEEIVGIISKQGLTHLHEKNRSDWMAWPHGSPAPQTQSTFNIKSVTLSFHQETEGRRTEKIHFSHENQLFFCWRCSQRYHIQA